MTDLSPAAQAVLNAVTLKRYDVPYQACPKSIDQIRSSDAKWEQRQQIRAEILAIAAELENK